MLRLLPLSLAVLLTACAEPPLREMNLAQGAIDGARAAGAEQYAPDALAAAVDALKRSEEAVSQNDYRLALGLAIDSREQAQIATKNAVDARAKARGDAERVLAEVATLLAQARERLTDPAVARLPRRVLQGPQTAVADVETRMQEARAALEAHDYPRAIELANAAAPRVREALTAIHEAAAAPARRPRR